MTNPRTRATVDRMIHRRCKRLGDNWHTMVRLRWSINPTLADLLWRDLRERGWLVELEEYRGSIDANTVHGRTNKSVVIDLTGTHWTWMDVIARLWLEVSEIERKVK